MMSFLKTMFRNKLFANKLQKIFKGKQLALYSKVL